MGELGSDLISIARAAELLGVSRTTVARRVRTGTLGSVHVQHGSKSASMVRICDLGSVTLAHGGPHKPARGEDHGGATLTEETVRRIRDEYASGKTMVWIARSNGLSYSVVLPVVSGQTWKHSYTDADARAYRERRRRYSQPVARPDPPTDAQIREWHARGSSVQRISARTGLGRNEVWRILGDPTERTDPLGQREIRQIVRRWVTGEYTMHDLAHQFGVSRQRIEQILSATGRGGDRNGSKRQLHQHAALYIRAMLSRGATQEQVAEDTGYSIAQIKLARSLTAYPDIPPKVCKCGKDSTMVLFSADRSRADGSRIICRECQRTRHNQWYSANRESHIAKVVTRRTERVAQDGMEH